MTVEAPARTLAVHSEQDLLITRHVVREAALAAKFSLTDQTRVVTAVSELARNAYIHGGGGDLMVEHLCRAGERGLRVTISDRGPGIADLDTALLGGGNGLSGARLLMDEFELLSAPGEGTTVTVARWTRA